MKLFVLVEASNDDDGNFSSGIHSTHKTRDEAVEELKNWHDEVISWFTDPDDDFEEDLYFDITEAEDIEIRRECHIEELEIN